MAFEYIDRRIVTLGIARMADAVANSFLIVVLPLYIASGVVEGRTFGLSEAAITGITLGAFGLVGAVVQPIAGRISDRAGKRTAFILGGLLVLGLVTVAYAYTTSYLSIIAVRLLQAGAVAFTIVGSVALVSELSPRERRGANMGIYNSFRLFGFGSGPLIAGVIVTHGPYSTPLGILSRFDAAFYGAALAAFISAGLVAWLVSDPPDIQPTRERMSLRVFSDEPKRWLDPIFTLGLSSLFMAACISMLSPIEPIVNERLGQGPILFAVEFAAYIGTQVAFQPYLGRLTDQFGRRKFIVWGLIGLIPATSLQGLVVAPWQLIMVRLLQGGVAAMVFAPALALAGDLARKGQSGAQLAVLTVSFGLGISLGQFISGFLVRFGFVVPFLAGGALAAVGLVLVLTQVEEDVPPEVMARREEERVREEQEQAWAYNEAFDA